MSDLQLRGPSYGGAGTGAPFRSDGTGAQATSDAHGRYAEGSRRKQIYWACSQAATTWSVALTATHTGLVVSNPIGSSVNLEILKASFALSVAPAAISTVGFFAGSAAAGLVTHTTPLVPLSSFLQTDIATGQARADGAATLPGTPRWLEMFLGGFTAATLFGTSPCDIDVGGLYTIPPGAFFGIGALTAVVGFGSIAWEEVPVLVAT